ncbi:c-type cytochrome [Sphingomonas bacterium]|uniref:c-type cytochrome n=1 Tax=Sphingomonas bacterium TaxID=1895847 RepID=UPI001C2D54E0|nr:cytochrome c [Sphingomonas bacterium]
MTRISQAATLRWIAGGIALTAAMTGAVAQFGAGYHEQTGQELYSHICQGCHMADAKGAIGAGAYPALAGDPKLAARMYPVVVILRGQKAMPAFADLTDAQIAEVTNYVRSHFGNSFPGTVSADDVKAMRPQGGAHDALRPG